MKQAVANLIRSTIPRPIRNALRRPRSTVNRIIAKSQFMFGRSAELSLRRDWQLHCHPICVPEFSVFATDSVQRNEMDRFVRRCGNEMRLLDVGAHWGIFTLTALKYGGPTVRSVCIEPSPNAAKIMRWNLKLNGIGDQVKIIEAAAGQTTGHLQMLTTGAGGADYMVVPPEHRPDSVAIPQIDLTSLCASLEFVPTHLKMDIEGFEQEGLLGALEILRRHRPILFLELHGDLIRRRNRDPQAVLQILTDAGYAILYDEEQPVDLAQLASCGFNARLLGLPRAQASR